jgi:hypothetical protein
LQLRVEQTRHVGGVVVVGVVGRRAADELAQQCAPLRQSLGRQSDRAQWRIVAQNKRLVALLGVKRRDGVAGRLARAQNARAVGQLLHAKRRAELEQLFRVAQQQLADRRVRQVHVVVVGRVAARLGERRLHLVHFRREALARLGD